MGALVKIVAKEVLRVPGRRGVEVALVSIPAILAILAILAIR
jgi:hypothetical protein